MSASTYNVPLMPSTRSYNKLDLGGAGNRTSSQDRAFVSNEACVEHIELRRKSAGIDAARNHASSDDGRSASSSLSSLSSLKSGGKELSGADRLKETLIRKWEARNQRVSLFEAWQRKLPTIETETGDARSVDNNLDGFAVKY